MTPQERFEAKYIPDPNSGCWLWTAATFPGGYGVLQVSGKAVLAHRFAYETYRGPIPKGLQIDHLCRTRCCVNPDHMEPVTLGENIRRGISHNGSKSHCPHGHPYAGDNLGLNKDGSRFCRQCSRDNANKQYQKKKDKLSTEIRLNG